MIFFTSYSTACYLPFFTKARKLNTEDYAFYNAFVFSLAFFPLTRRFTKEKLKPDLQILQIAYEQIFKEYFKSTTEDFYNKVVM